MNKKGGIIIENLAGLTLLLLTLYGMTYINFKIWAHSFINLEKFFLARATLYDNSHNCGASKLVSQDLIQRKYICEK
jgi:hypothetical protein